MDDKIMLLKHIFLVSQCCLFMLMPNLGVAGNAAFQVPILVYHRFASTVLDSMTVRASTFEGHLRVLHSQGYTVIPLRDLLDFLTKRRTTLPAKPVVLTADDGHRSQYLIMFPLVQRDRFPVTLFIYPSAISNASYAMTWDEIHHMQQSGLFDIQSHTYWHPNFAQERKHRDPQSYLQFVRKQLSQSKTILEKRSGHSVDLLAWPFGIYDASLMDEARAAGYEAAFSLKARPVTCRDSLLALPRFLIVDSYDEKAFAAMLRKNSMVDSSPVNAGACP